MRGRESIVRQLTNAIQLNLVKSASAADRILAGKPRRGDRKLLRAGEKSLEFLMGKIAT